MSSQVEFDAMAVGSVAQRLDALADRLDTAMRQASGPLTIVPAAIDEVSQRAARSLNDVSHDYQGSYAAGVHELRKLAANLRSHTGNVTVAEDTSAAGFGRMRI